MRIIAKLCKNRLSFGVLASQILTFSISHRRGKRCPPDTLPPLTETGHRCPAAISLNEKGLIMFTHPMPPQQIRDALAGNGSTEEKRNRLLLAWRYLLHWGRQQQLPLSDPETDTQTRLLIADQTYAFHSLLFDINAVLELKLDDKSIVYGGETQLRVKVTNKSDQPIELKRHELSLRTTVRKRGIHPKHEVKRDETYDCFKSAYSFGLPPEERRLRATSGEKLFTSTGCVGMYNGMPSLVIEKDGVLKHASHNDAERALIAGNTSQEFIYSIGSGWYINEYELQVNYYYSFKTMSLRSILSPPLSFDITANK